MIKGIIADVNENKAVLLTEDGEFLTIKNQSYTIGQKLTYKKPAANKYMALVASIMIVFLLALSGTRMYYTPVSYVDVDINPSLRFEVNRFGIVTKVVPLNADAKLLLSSSDPVSGKVQKCIDKLIEESVEAGYLSEDNKEIEIYVITEDSKLLNNISQSVSVYSEEKMLCVSVNTESFSELEKAKELNVTVGKLKNIEAYTEANGGTLKDNATVLCDKSNKEIKELSEAAVIQNNEDNAVAILPTPEPVTTEEPKASETPKPAVYPTTKPENKDKLQADVSSVIKATDEPVALNTAKPTAIATPAATVACTPEPTVKPVVTVTPKPTAVATPVAIEKPTATATPSTMPTATPTATPSTMPTATPTATPSPTPTATPTATPSSTPTATPTATSSPTPMVTPSATPNVTEQATATPTPTAGEDGGFNFGDIFFDIINGSIFAEMFGEDMLPEFSDIIEW